LVRRFGEDALWHNSGAVGESAATLLARSIRGGVLREHRGSLARFIAAPPFANDFGEATTLSRDIPRLLKLLSWPQTHLPKSLGIPFALKDIEHFLDGSVLLPARGGEKPVPFYLPFDWNAHVTSRAAEEPLYGLDFIASVLSYWYLKANRFPSRRMQPIDE